MYPAAFEYHAPTSVKEALGLLGKHKDDAKLLAGGHSLIPMMKLRLAQPKHLIDLRKVPGLTGIKQDGNMLAIGAMTTHWEVESSALVKSKLAVLSEVAAIIGDPAVRNRGTVGGSLAHADPAADYPAAVIALGAPASGLALRRRRRRRGGHARQQGRVLEGVGWYHGRRHQGGARQGRRGRMQRQEARCGRDRGSRPKGGRGCGRAGRSSGIRRVQISPLPCLRQAGPHGSRQAGRRVVGGGAGDRGRSTTRHASAHPVRLGSIIRGRARCCLEGTGLVDPYPPLPRRLPDNARVGGSRKFS